MRVTGKTRERKFFLFPLVFLLLGNKYTGNSYVEGSYSFFSFFLFFKSYGDIYKTNKLHLETFRAKAL